MTTAGSPTSAPVHVLSVGPSTLTFYRGDCLDVLTTLAAASVGVVVTSPPYNLGTIYRSYVDNLPRTEYLDFTARWVAAVARLLRPDGSLFLNIGAKPTEPLMPHEVALVAARSLTLQNTIHWVKSIALDCEAAGQNAGLDRDIAVGHYKPVNSDRFVNDCHEYLFHFTPQGRTPLDRRAIGVPYQDASNAKRWATAGDGLRCRGNNWFVPYETIQSRDRDRPHPATFPPKLPEQCIRLHGVQRAGLVLDPFLGLGNSAIAAVRLGLDFIGIELDDAYLNEAVHRVQAAAGVAADVRPMAAQTALPLLEGL